MDDPNIKKILKTIFSYVPHTSVEAERVRNNFLVVEWDKGNNNTDVVQYDIVIDNEIIKVNKLKTDNFTGLYMALSDLNLPISAMDIRKVQNIVGEIYKGDSGIKVQITEDIDNLKNSDKVLAIGSSNNVTYTYQNAKQLMQDYFDVVEEANVQRISLIDKYKIASNQFFAVYAFLKIYPELNNGQELMKIEQDKVTELTRKLSMDLRIRNRHNTIQDILQDENIKQSYKINAIAYSVLISKNITIDALGDFLKEKKFIQGTDYNKLLVIYDFLKYKDII